MQFDETAEQTRTYQIRTATVDADRREIRGCGVPLEVETEIMPGFREVFAQDCEFENIDRAKLKHGHRELIGVVAEHTRVAGELQIVGRASRTVAGDDALALAGDGALDSFSIGFRARDYELIEHDDGSVTVRHTRVWTREFSVTDDPAYLGATITEVRERHSDPNPEGNPTMPDTLTREALDAALDTRFEEAERSLDARLAAFTQAQQQPRLDLRSAGAILQAIAAGDEDTIREYNELMERAYTGGTSADSPIKDGWVGDLTRLFDSSTGVLSAFFSTGVLPDKGMNIEFAELDANTVQVTEQEDEGDDLATGKVTLTTRTAPVKTYGGYVELTRQQIERSTLPILDRSLEAMTLAAGARKKSVLRAAYLALVAARIAIAADAGVLKLGATLAASTATQWTNLIIDAADRYDSLALPLDGMIVSTSVFKRLNALEVEGHRVFKVADERQIVGTLDLPGLAGDMGGITVVCDPGRAGDAAEFANARAVRQYDSAVAQLQDENIINLSKAFSVYRYGAVAAEIPAAVVPIKLSA